MGFLDFLQNPALSPDENKQYINNQLLSLGAALLQGSAPTTDPRSKNLGYILGGGINAMQKDQGMSLAKIMEAQKIKAVRDQQEQMNAKRDMMKTIPLTELAPTRIPNWNTQGVQYNAPEMFQAMNQMKTENPAYYQQEFAATEQPRGLSDVIREAAAKSAQMADMSGAAKLAISAATLDKSVVGNPADNQIVEIQDPTNPKKNIKALVDKNTGKMVAKVGDVLETFKPKNLLGRGWITKRPIMQSNDTGQAVYEDTGEPVPPEDKTNIRPLTIKGLEAGQVSELSGLKNTYNRLEDVSDKAQKMKDKFGPLNGRWNQLRLKFINDGPTQEVQNELKSMITIAYGLSGKQISIQEMQMLQDALLPALTQPFENFEATLKFAKDWVGKTHDDRLSYFNQAGFDANIKPLISGDKKPPKKTEDLSDPLGLRGNK